MPVAPRKPKKEQAVLPTLPEAPADADAPAPVQETPAETVAEAPAETPAQEAPAERTQADIDAGLLRVLRQRNTHSPTPTLLRYRMRDSVKRRWVFVDIDAGTMAAAWAWWRENVGSYDQEAFVIAVHRVMEASLPRVYRRVDPLELE